ncbi:MAG: hypothetical protein M0033_04035 [Nitrospiraceae bacterium]|nr:hypothetical protein [Nitrospiraceae bacterium]
MPKKPKAKFSVPDTSKTATHKFAAPVGGYYERYPEFSFKHYAHAHKEYSCRCITAIDDFYEFFEKLRAISALKWKDIKFSGHYHFHPIEWSLTAEPSGFKELPAILKGYPACQFKIFGECRIIGFFNQNNIFEIVWIDRHHKVYPGK